MIMKKIFLISIFNLFLITFNPFAQTQNGCDIDFPNNFDDQVVFSSIYDASACATGDVVLNNVNDKNGQSTVTFDEDITLNSLTINYKAGNNPLEIIIPSGVTLTITEDLFFNVSSTPQDKFLTVNGTLDVGDELNFGSIDFEVDGTGLISANRITGAEQTTCTGTGGDGTCPTVSAGDCTDGGANGDGIGFCDESGALPIELKSFTASKSGKNIDLNWVTAKEENFSHFEIERSLDQENWSQIGLVQGLGESNSDVFYDFTDRNAPFGVIYYRLKAVDIDATFEYSPVVKIENGFEGKLAVSPNPVQDASNLKIQVPNEFRDKLAYVGLFDLNGTKVQEFRDFNTDGSLQINQQLKAGMYILKVNHNGLQENIRVVVQ
jgi:hypothetical protein